MEKNSQKEYTHIYVYIYVYKLSHCYTAEIKHIVNQLCSN